jgi:hypothetical protein
MHVGFLSESQKERDHKEDLDLGIRRVCDYRRGTDWILDLLITYTHNSELQVITASLLISTLYKSLHAKFSPACNVFNSPSLATASNSGDSLASRAQIHSTQLPP